MHRKTAEKNFRIDDLVTKLESEQFGDCGMDPCYVVGSREEDKGKMNGPFYLVYESVTQKVKDQLTKDPIAAF